MATQEQQAEAKRLAGEDTSVADQATANAKDHQRETVKANQAPKKAPPASAVAAQRIPERAGEKGRIFTVQDTSATMTAPSRTHEIMMNGQLKSITFKYGEPTPLPFVEAMKFQKEGFIIRNEDGGLVERPPENRLEDVQNYGPDKVVANLSELRRDALYARATTLPGGEKYNPQTSVSELIDFLIASAKQRIGENSKKERGVEEMDDSDMDNIGLAAE